MGRGMDFFSQLVRFLIQCIFFRRLRRSLYPEFTDFYKQEAPMGRGMDFFSQQVFYLL